MSLNNAYTFCVFEVALHEEWLFNWDTLYDLSGSFSYLFLYMLYYFDYFDVKFNW